MVLMLFVFCFLVFFFFFQFLGWVVHKEAPKTADHFSPILKKNALGSRSEIIDTNRIRYDLMTGLTMKRIKESYFCSRSFLPVSEFSKIKYKKLFMFDL